MKQRYLLPIRCLDALACAFVLAFLAAPGAVNATTDGLRINELMYAPPQQTNGENLDWIELYNQGANPITIVGGASSRSWTLTDQYGTHYFASEAFRGSMTIPGAGYAVIADNPGAFLASHPFFQGTLINAPLSLSDTKGSVIIKDGTGRIVAQANWNQTQGGAGNGKTLEFSSRDNALREGLRVGGSPGEQNSVEGIILPPVTPVATPWQQTKPTPVPSPQASTAPSPDFPVINEVYANPSVGAGQWIELKNERKVPIQLQGWSIRIASGQQTVALNGTMSPGSLMLLSGDQWGFSLNPQADTIQVIDSAKRAVFKVTYASPLPKGWSANRITGKSWEVSDRPTPGEENIIHTPQETIPQTPDPITETIPAFPLAAAYNPDSGATKTAPTDRESVAIIIFAAAGAGIAGAIAFLVAKKRFVL